MFSRILPIDLESAGTVLNQERFLQPDHVHNLVLPDAFSEERQERKGPLAGAWVAGLRRETMSEADLTQLRHELRKCRLPFDHPCDRSLEGSARQDVTGFKQIVRNPALRQDHRVIEAESKIPPGASQRVLYRRARGLRPDVSIEYLNVEYFAKT